MLPINETKEQRQMRFVTGELAGLRKVISGLWDGNQEAFSALVFIKGNYKQWPDMIRWLKANNLKGQALADMFKNESPDGGGYHMGAEYILSRIKGNKSIIETVKINQLI